MNAEQPPHISANASGWNSGLAVNGMRLRKAARVLLFDPQGRVLLVRGHDSDRPERQWWFTIGGGIDPGETAAQAAVREVFEETGIEIMPDQLVGPVIERTAIFDFETEHCVQNEQIFMVHLKEVPATTSAGWTEVENNFLEEVAWLSVQEIEGSAIEVFPANLAEVVHTLAAGWDGTIINLGIEGGGTV